ncbi:cytidylyltransferase domain-containing protein [Polynucleobacter sp. MWH-UH25E]|uniref:cytidylyltransferase domain-containing protein n=1 Tax=Polynucleobacter sp. MWH-UH25E TaxID=1855616 RepID=UPI001BFCDCA3|nr:hypothetical protein [Polynucleobacter sp. MWH-UH25E]QWD62352.1 hypothetical protein ICV39_01680 [Polynucleobacter sp. MWH-UH25E]
MPTNVSGFITVRTSSSRLPNKCLLPFGDGNVLEHVIRRAKHYEIEPIVCTSTDKSDDIIVEIAKNEGVKFFRGELRNKLKRWADCATFFDLTSFHTIDADDPFFDGVEIKSSMALLRNGSYEMVSPSKVSSSGGGSVGFSLATELISRAVSDLAQDEDTEMMWFYLEKISNIRSITLLDNPLTPKNLRLTLDYQEDYWLLESVRRIVGNYATRDCIDRLFIDNPDLYKVNWFRNEDWKLGQVAKKF